MPTTPSAPRSLAFSVAFVAAAMLLVELLVTRIFSVLFFYHFSFFAISLIMSGLAFGGLLAARWDVRSMKEEAFRFRLAACGFVFSAGLTAAMGAVVAISGAGTPQASFLSVAFQAAIFLPCLTAAGAFLAAAFARNAGWINRLYAFDLIAAALACLGAIYLMRGVPGPSALLVPALLAGIAGLIITPKRARSVMIGGAVCLAAAGLLAGNAALGWRFLRLTPGTENLVYEGWNEHSRVQALEIKGNAPEYQNIVIDRTASTLIPRLDARDPGAPLSRKSWWDDGEVYLAYQLGRPLNNVAIIGVGGGMDVLAPLAVGAGHVDGYELNGLIVDYHRERMDPRRSIASWPEVTLIHNEARVGIAHSGKKYDVIQASMIDTWAATASGGFVLSENGLYTIDGWRIFLDSLTDTGVLTMTRWFAQRAETYRLVALATAALKEQGIEDPRNHIILAGPDHRLLATIIVSKTPFMQREVESIVAIATKAGMALLALPGAEAREPVIRALLDPVTRESVIEDSELDLSVPTDLRPYFFLLLRPRDVLGWSSGSASDLYEITFNGIRVLMIMGGLSLFFALAVFAFGIFALPSTPAGAQARRIQRRMGVYFLCIGLGYIFVQLALHQRLILILGHPTLALSVVLFSMLLGTGTGAALSSRLFPDGQFKRAWLAILLTIMGVIVCFPLLPLLERIDVFIVRAAVAGILVGVAGFTLGFGFPLGVRLVASAGEHAVQRMWAVNGAASIAGSALAAINGVVWGCRASLIAGLLIYGAAMLAGRAAERAIAEGTRKKGTSNAG